MCPKLVIYVFGLAKMFFTNYAQIIWCHLKSVFIYVLPGNIIEMSYETVCVIYGPVQL